MAVESVILRGSSENEAQTEQYTYGDWASQKWRFEKVDGEYYKIVNSNSGKVLDVQNLSTAENAEVVQYEYNEGWNQQWKVIATAEDTYKIQNRNSGLYLGISGNSTYDGAWAVQVSSESDSAEWFLLLAD